MKTSLHIPSPTRILFFLCFLFFCVFPSFFSFSFFLSPSAAHRSAYLRAKQHMIPVLPRNHKKPINRMIERNAVAKSKNLKNQAVRADADSCKERSKS